MKMAFVSIDDPADLTSWSGIVVSMKAALEEQFESVAAIGPLETYHSPWYRLKRKLYQTILRRTLIQEENDRLLRHWTRQASRALRTTDHDVVLSSYPPALRNLDSTAPRVLWTDCNFAGMPDFYHPPLPHSRLSLAKVHQMEQEAISQCSLIVYSSQWAADTLIANYDVDPSRVKVVPFGPNLVITHTAEDIERIVAARPTDRCNLVWIGTDGGRKRSWFAVELVEALNQHGLPTHLTIIGIDPEPSDPIWDLEHVTCLGFLDKSRTDERVRFEACLSEAHFLIHPAEAEAFGMVLCEAISHGVPCLASGVGGIPTIVKTGVTGHLFSPNASIAEYCDVINRYIAHRRDYRELARSTFNEFEIRLNWPCAARQMRELIEEYC